MLLPLEFEMLRPLHFFLERKKLFVEVEMSEAILHAFKDWDQNPRMGGLGINKSRSRMRCPEEF